MYVHCLYVLHAYMYRSEPAAVSLQGRTPLMFACSGSFLTPTEKKYRDAAGVAELLIRASADVNVSRFILQTYTQ